MPSNKDTTKKHPPVIAVMGHVDHGKTSLLDYIRKSNVAEKESGGITQHIGAYQITHADRVMTFLDTPGHEAFSEMRRRGAHVADLAVIVIAADEGVKPQTLEALKHAQEAKIPFVIAFNKIDKPNADTNRVKKDLSEKEILTEDWGGSIPSVEVSAKSGQGVPELLDMLLLMWDIEDLEAAEAGSGMEGVVIESRLDARRGPTATVLVTIGTLKTGDIIACGKTIGKIRILENFKGEEISEATVATPVRIIGLEEVPVLGDTCRTVAGIEEGQALVDVARKTEEADRTKAAAVIGGTTYVLPLILKSDVKGSEEAIRDALAKIVTAEAGIRIIESGVGDITEADIKSAVATKAKIIGFRAGISHDIEQFARQKEIPVARYDLIYDCLEGIRKELASLLPAEIIKKPYGKAKVLAVFKREKDGIIVGGRVTQGKLVRGVWCDLMRDGELIAEGRLRELKIIKDSAAEVKEGQECGMLYVGKGEPKIGDTLESYEREERRREL
ncbi:MAG: translation initiation factor IF-2 [bacterium]|nr:translation initiation factor IF-2 [bacterium]